MTRQDYVEHLIKEQKERYNKKFAFERGQFQQCMPNPDPEKKGEMITVQLVQRVLQESESQKDVKSTCYKKYEIQIDEEKESKIRSGIDNVSGVSAFQLGELVEKVPESTDFFKAMMAGTEYAIIAHWDLNE